MKPPANLFQRMRPRIKKRLSPRLEQAAEITSVYGGTIIPPGGRPANIQLFIMSILFRTPLKFTGALYIPRGRHLPFHLDNCQIPLTGNKQMPGRVVFLGVALPFIPLISMEKFFFRNNYRGGNGLTSSAPAKAGPAKVPPEAGSMLQE